METSSDSPSARFTIRFSARNYFITYPRCPLSKEDVLNKLKHLRYPVNCIYIRVCQEQHSDGGYHLHSCLVQFSGKFNCRNYRFFDINGDNSSETFHPNVQSARRADDVSNYIAKAGNYIEEGTFRPDGRKRKNKASELDEHYSIALKASTVEGNYIEEGTFRPDGRKRKNKASEFDEHYSRALKASTVEGNYIEEGTFRPEGRKRKATASELKEHYSRALKASTVEESLAIIKEHDPRRYCRHYRTIVANAERIFGRPMEVYKSPFDPESFVVPEELMLWARNNIGPNRPDRPMSLIIEGPSGLGKTEWARSLGPHNYFKGFMDFNRKTFSNESWYNVIDDVPPARLLKKHWNELIGAKHSWQADSKYAKPIQIKGGIASIVLCNNAGRRYSYKSFLDRNDKVHLREWTIVNAEFYFANTPFYRSGSS